MFIFNWKQRAAFKQSHAKQVVQRMQLNNLLIIGLVTLSMSGVLSVMMYFDAKNIQFTRAQTLAHLLAQNIQPALIFGNETQIITQLAMLQKQPEIIAARVYRNDASLVTAYHPRYTGLPASQLTPANWDSQIPPQQFSAQDYLNTTFSLWQRLYTVVPLRHLDANGELLGQLVLITDMSEPRQEIVFQIGSIFLIGLVSFLVMAYRLQGLIRPMEAMLTRMRRVIPHDETIIMPNRPQQKIATISEIFNAMVVEIEGRDQALNLELAQRKAAEMQLAITARVDAVTQLPNRHAFNQEIELAYRRFTNSKHNFALMFIDLDNFKYVNDNFGHAAGDSLLQQVGERIRTLLRSEDFVARIGGDEFVVILHNFTELEHVSHVADKIIKTLNEPFQIQPNEAYIGASIGITSCPQHCAVFAELVRQADSAMYLAKKNGKNNYQYFHDGLAADVEARVKMEGELRHALSRQEIEVHYQPIVALASQQIVGFEALLRWTLADGKVIEPEQFVPLAEEIGLIAEFGAYTLT